MKKLLLVVLGMVMLSGCMSFNEKMLRTVDIPKQQNELYVEVKTGELIQRHNGVAGRGVLSGTTVLKSVSKSMMSRWKSKGIITKFDYSGSLDHDPDFTMLVSGVRDEESSILLAVLTGLTLYIIPSNATLIYDLDVEFINNKTQTYYTVKVKNGVTTWSQIIFLPFFFISWVGSYNSLTDMADYTYEELRKQGAFN